MDKKAILENLINMSIQMNSEYSINKLLETVMEKAREITNADAGSLYLKVDNNLKFLVTQNDTLNNQNTAFNVIIPVDKKSIAGYVAYTGEHLNIKDAYNISSDYPFVYNTDFDEKNNYRCVSMLVVPMKDNTGNIIGVIQLINAKNKNGNTVDFNETIEPIINSFASMAAMAVKNVQLKDTIKKAYLDTIYRLSVAAEFRDLDTGLHIKRMSVYSQILAEEMGKSDEFCEKILYASPLHDVGKIGIPDRILLKPAKLDADEWIVMKQHTIMGYEILKDSEHELMNISSTIALSHHERFDGNGYPHGMSGNDIPIEGRIVALADVFDALSSKRPYKKPWAIEKILIVIREERGKQFDEKVIDAFNKGLKRILETRDKLEDEF